MQHATARYACHRLELRLHAGQELADGAAPEGHRRIDRHHRRGLGGAVAFEDADAELLEPSSRTGSASFSAPAIT